MFFYLLGVVLVSGCTGATDKIFDDEYKMKPFIVFGVILLGISPPDLLANDQRYENLHNPVEYVFNNSEAKITEALHHMHGPDESGRFYGAYVDGVYGFGFHNFYTTRYWSGRQEKDEEVVPSEAGRIGTIQADFEVRVVSKTANQTLVSVIGTQFEQQVGRRYRLFPHFHKGPVYENVKSDTYFEYLFLLKLGELLGEKNMLPIKGKP